jgi:hypothetical protein
MTYIPSSGSSGDLGRFHIIKPDFSSYTNTSAYYRFDYSQTDGWCDRRHPNPSYGTTVDPLAWVVARNDLKSNVFGRVGDGYFESGTYSVSLRVNYRYSDVFWTHLPYPTFTGISGVTVTSDLASSTSGSSIAFAPTTRCTYFEQGGLFHVTLGLDFVLTSDDYWSGINTAGIMHGKNHPSYSSTNNGYNSSFYNITCVGAETEILKLA